MGSNVEELRWQTEARTQPSVKSGWKIFHLLWRWLRSGVDGHM